MTDIEIIQKVNSIDWEFAEADTQYYTHNIHRYSGKFIPQIAQKAIEILTTPGEIILDSYMGSGTTLLEATLDRRNSIGVDLNPLAVLISKVKNTVVAREDLLELHERIIPFVERMLADGQISILDKPFDEELCESLFEKNEWRLNDEWNKKWYQPDVLHQLVKIYAAIETIDNDKARDIAKVAFSDILRKSSNASSKYPNVMYDKNSKKKPLPAKAFLESLNHVINAVLEMSDAVHGYDVSPQIIMHNNLNLPIENDTVDAIVSHPPYIAAVPYAEYGCLSLVWLGYDNKELDNQLTGGKRHSSKVVDRFTADYEKYFIESYRVLKRGGTMFLMVGNPVSHGEKVDLNAMTVEFAKRAGFTHLVTAIREGQNRRGNKMGEEYLLFFRKK